MDVVLAPNPGFMTGPGTNQYLRGDLLIDVAPYDAENARRLGAALAGRRLAAIVLTHIHPDYVGGAAALRAASGAPIAVHRSRADFAYAGSALAPERLLDDGVEIVHAGGRLRAVHTPGHESGHCCYYDPDRRWLYTGDLIHPALHGAAGLTVRAHLQKLVADGLVRSSADDRFQLC